jgi:hypothetical protein
MIDVLFKIGSIGKAISHGAKAIGSAAAGMGALGVEAVKTAPTAILYMVPLSIPMAGWGNIKARETLYDELVGEKGKDTPLIRKLVTIPSEEDITQGIGFMNI